MRWTNKQSSEQERNLQNFEMFWEKDNEKKNLESDFKFKKRQKRE